MREIFAGDALDVGDLCKVRGCPEDGRVEERPTATRRTYLIRMPSGTVIEREWLQIDRVIERKAPTRDVSAGGRPIVWDTHPPPSCGKWAPWRGSGETGDE